MTADRGPAPAAGPVVAVAERLPSWATLVRAPNPGPMTLEGTNTWVLRARGAAEVVVVDPGPAHEQHLRAAAGHGPVAAVLITHEHPDHVDGLARFCELASGTSKHGRELASGTGERGRELTGVPVWSASGGELAGLPPARSGSSGELAGVRVVPMATPGHTADSVCFQVEADGEQAILTGDTILGRGTTVVAPPDGDLGDYLASLERLASLEGMPVLPGHGPALADCAEAASYYLAHRRARLDQVRAAVADGATTPAEIVAVVYADLDRELWPAAEWTVQAQLEYIKKTSRESETGIRPLDRP